MKQNIPIRLKSIDLLQQTITLYKILHAGRQAHYYSRTGTSKTKPSQASLVQVSLFQCHSAGTDNNELALQHGKFCTMWSFVAKGLFVSQPGYKTCELILLWMLKSSNIKTAGVISISLPTSQYFRKLRWMKPYMRKITSTSDLPENSFFFSRTRLKPATCYSVFSARNGV